MSDIKVTITGDKELVRKINSFVGSGEFSFQRSLGAAGLYLTDFFAGDVFVSRGRVIGKPWARLNESYAQWKAQHFPGRPPLVKSGEMMRGFESKAGPRKLELWNTADHFDWQNDGTSRIPARQMMRIDDQRAARVVKYIMGDLTERMQSRGLI